MDPFSRALRSKLVFLPRAVFSSSGSLDPLRWITKRTIRMASSNPSSDTAPSFTAATAPTFVPATTDAANFSSTAASPSASSAIDFLSLCQHLKKTKRAGWARKGVQDSESVADHMYRMGMMAFVAPCMPGVDRDRCIKMALVHDIGEAIVGDITPSDGVPKDEKSRREKEAINHMCNLLGGGSRAEEILELWLEYEENSSLEAKFVKDFDKVELILQALEYEQEQGKDLEEFFQSATGKLQTDVGKAWASEITSRRKKCK